MRLLPQVAADLVKDSDAWKASGLAVFANAANQAATGAGLRLPQSLGEWAALLLTICSIIYVSSKIYMIWTAKKNQTLED